MNGGSRRWWAWAALGTLAFLAVAVRTLGESRPTFLQGDLALLHVDSLRAAGFHQLLGPYDRFGWHHPGPAYAYLLSVVDRIVGFTRPLQAEALTAVVVNGASLTAAVVLARRRLGPGPAAGVLLLGWLSVVGLGNDVVFNPWSPTVVILPMVLLGVLSVAAVAGRHRSEGDPARPGATGAIGALLVGTFCLQTDLGTLPLVGPCVAVVLVMAAVRLVVRQRPVAAAEMSGRTAGLPTQGPSRRALAVAAGSAVVVAAWIPVLVQEWTKPAGNISRIVDFFLAGHRHAGIAAGARAAGWAQLAVLGDRPPGAPPVGAAGSWMTVTALVVSGVLLLVGLRWRRPAAVAGAALWLAGTGVAVLAGAEIVGPPYTYLTYWAAAPLVGGAVALGDLGAAGLLARHRRSAVGAGGRAESILVATVLLAGLAVTGDLLSRRAVVSYSSSPVATAWSDVLPLLPAGVAVGVAYPNQPSTWNVGTGLVDRLEAGGRPVTVLPFWSNQVATTSLRFPTTWVSVLPAGSPLPSGPWQAAGSVAGVSLYTGNRPAPATG